MKKKPLISIIITYYKKKIYLKKTIKSILDQSYKNYELIFVYDDKNLEDLDYIKNLTSKFKKKRLIVNKKNFGVAKSRNIGVKFCKGSYIAFIDSDDLWNKDKLSKQVDFMQKNSYLFSFTSYIEVDEEGNFRRERKVYRDANYTNLYRSNFIGLSTVMINKKIFSKINFPILNTQEDFALWLKLARQGIKLKHFKNSLSFWRKTKNSLSSNIIRKFNDAFKLYYFYEKKNFIFSIYSVLVLSYNKLIKIF